MLSANFTVGKNNKKGFIFWTDGAFFTHTTREIKRNKVPIKM